MLPSITFLGRVLPMYVVMALIGALLIGFLLCREIRRQGQNDNDAIVMLLISALGVLVGGHLLFGITNISHWGIVFEAESFWDLCSRLAALWGGQVFYGGLIGGMTAGLVFLRLKRLDIRLYMDAMAPLIPLFHAFARVGCFFAGCCYGVESSFGFIAHGNSHIPELNDVRRFPVQLLEALCNLLIFAVLYWLYSRVRGKKQSDVWFFVRLRGNLLPVYFALYAIVRFFDEFLRGDSIRGFVFGGFLSTSQLISIIMGLIAAAWLCTAFARQEKQMPGQLQG